ncbi:MAG TPA: hypothetical protein VHM91_08855, partial [Verrucomicrobiales bacterium]|nr:hypothetical protein [Verrucomicrobiales bacterium]
RRKAVMEMAAMKEWSASIFAGERNKTKEDTGMEGLLKQWEEKMPEKVQAAVRDADRVDWKTHLETHAAFVRALIKANNHSLAAFRASFDPPKDNVVTKGTALEPYFDSETGSGSEMPFIRLTSNASSRVRLARAILLLRAYELDHGRLPTSLGEMIPDYWPSVPEDPFDGKPLRYDAATRRVWCVGENLKDDKGDLASAPFPAQWCVGENLKDDKGANDYKAKDKPDDVGMTFPVWK